MTPAELNEIIGVASELMTSVARLEAHIGSQLDRQRIVDRVTPLDAMKVRPFRLELGGMTLFANQWTRLVRRGGEANRIWCGAHLPTTLG